VDLETQLLQRLFKSSVASEPKDSHLQGRAIMAFETSFLASDIITRVPVVMTLFRRFRKEI
jgi:hypothetical protein